MVLLASYEDGSTETIDAHRGTPKKRIQIMGRAPSVVDDSKSIICDRREVSVSGAAKGHTSHSIGFHKSARSNTPNVLGIRTSLYTTDGMLAVLQPMAVGEIIRDGSDCVS